MPSALILSYYNDPNFGDRLGYHIANSLLPANTEVHHASVRPWDVPDRDYDMLIIGIGNSLNAATVSRDEFFRLVDRIPIRIGIFGTQYAHQYRNPKIMPVDRFDQLLDNLTVWFARYREDIRQFGSGRTNVTHLGDWLISAFPMAQWRKDNTLTIPPEIKSQTLPLDRTIQRIQQYRRVDSARLHPLLCALTSAEQVVYHEQREDPYGSQSGKFGSMLLDIFGQSYPPDQYFNVDRDKVMAYKLRVAENLAMLRSTLHRLLDCEEPAPGPAPCILKS